MSGFRIIAWSAVLAGALAASASAQTQVTALVGATLIDGTERAPVPNAVVLVRNGWITAAGPKTDVKVPAGARVFDVAGRYVLPGFVEMHGHLAIGVWELDTTGGKPRLIYAYDEVATRELTKSQLAFGITTVRNPAGPTREAVSIRNRVRLGELPGPRIITAGAPLDRPSIISATEPVTSEADARAAVNRQAAAGVDFIKLYDGLDSSQVGAAIDEAHKLGLPAVGHLWRTSWTDAARAGIDGITHIIVSNAKLLPAARRDEFEKRNRSQAMFDWFEYVDFDGPEIKELLGELVAHRVTIDPTIVAFETTAYWDDSTFYGPDADRYTPPTFAVKAKAMNALRGWSPAEYASAKAKIPLMQEFARRLYQVGVPLTVGTDGANPWLYHRELELLAKAGIPNADVIRMATRNAAISLRMTSEIGTVEAGKRADLVVLDADPLADIRNTRRIGWVMQNGKLSRPAEFLPARLTRK